MPNTIFTNGIQTKTKKKGKKKKRKKNFSSLSESLTRFTKITKTKNGHKKGSKWDQNVAQQLKNLETLWRLISNGKENI